MTKNDILETISNLYGYEFKKDNDGTILCYYASDPEKLLYQFYSENQLMMHWLPAFEDDDHGNFTKEINFIKSCMIQDYLDITGDYRYIDAKEKTTPSRQEMTDGQDDKKHNYLITMAAEESADMEIELTDKEYEIVARVFHEIDSKCHGLCGSVYIESLERDDMDEVDMEDREV